MGVNLICDVYIGVSHEPYTVFFTMRNIGDLPGQNLTPVAVVPNVAAFNPYPPGITNVVNIVNPDYDGLRHGGWLTVNFSDPLFHAAGIPITHRPLNRGMLISGNQEGTSANVDNAALQITSFYPVHK